MKSTTQNRGSKRAPVILLVFSILMAANASAASCLLDRPDNDVKRIFPESTTYQVREMSPRKNAPKNFVEQLRKKVDPPIRRDMANAAQLYDFYAVQKDQKQIGLILGITAELSQGPAQVFVAYEPLGKIREVFFQKISTLEAPSFRSDVYRSQFKRYTVANPPLLAEVKPPLRLPDALTLKDHQSVLKAIQFNAFLVETLWNGFRAK